MNSIEDPNITDLHRMTKAQLIEFIVDISLHHSQMMDRKDELLVAAKTNIKKTQRKLDQAEAYVEQARGMIESITEKWYHYED